MDEFKPEDELKPDTSDRRPVRLRKSSSAAKVPVSRQHMMMGVGILVLLLLVLGIGSALKGSDESEPASQAGNGTRPSPAATGGNEKTIDLSGSAGISGQNNGTPLADERAADTGAPETLSAPPIASTPTQAAPVETPQNQQRVELPGDLNSALTSQPGAVDGVVQGARESSSSLPTAPATVNASNASAAPSQPAAPQSSKPASTHKPAASQPTAKANVQPERESARRAAPAAGASAAESGVPGGNYTLQLSSASRSDTLNAWAKKQNLDGYHIYQTTRNGQPWYVLVSGSYATPAEAKRAVASLPADVRAKNPWVKPVSQVKKEAER